MTLRRWPGLVLLAALGLYGCDGEAPAADAGDELDGGTVPAVDGGDAGPGFDGGVPDVDGGPMGPDGGGVDGGGVDGGGVDGGGATDGGAARDAGPASCGDRRITAPEECDDGNTASGDGCDDMCRIETSATCGDGAVDRASGEMCDDGNTADGDGCSSRCQVEAPPMCGDGMLDLAAGEECDDGNTLPGDGCSPSCQFEAVGAFCGDGVVDPGEVCDDSNTANGDGCNPTCNLRGDVTTYVGMQGDARSLDGIGTMARVRGSGVLAVDDRYLWFAENGGGGAPAALRRVEIDTANVVTVAMLPGGAAEGVATDGTSTVWVATVDGTGPSIYSVATSAPFAVTRVTGSAPCGNAGCYADGAPGTVRFGGVRGLTWFAGFLYIVDPSAATIRRLDPATGDVVTVAGNPFVRGSTDGPGASAPLATRALFQSPRYIVSDNSGVLYISDTNGAAVRTYTVGADTVGTLAGNGTNGYVDGLGGRAGPARLHRPRGITADGASVYWVEFNAHTVRQTVASTLDVSTLAGGPVTTCPPGCAGGRTCQGGVCLPPSGGAPSGGGYMDGTGRVALFDAPFSIAYHHRTRSLFVADGGNEVIRRIQ